MPSFTSSSKSGAMFYSKILAVVCAALIVTLEISSDYLLRHNSETYARVSQQYAQAVRVRPAKPGEPTPILMVGNSLLLEGVDVKRLQKLTSGQMHIYPIFLEATGYYDWFYGLRRLFREGARPSVVVLGVGVNSFLADSVRQDYAPLMLFDLRDSLGVASDLKMDHTATSNLLLAHSSVFWDTRSVLRTQILRHTIPHYRELVSLLKPQPAIPPAPVFDSIANPRLERLRDLCQSYGARLILLIPPTPGSTEAVRSLTLAAQKANVETLVPIDPDVLSVKYYQPDELHLNSQGAALFTSALAAFLPQRVDHEAMTSPD
jgi:lysophospholipase L1-like esterase